MSDGYPYLDGPPNPGPYLSLLPQGEGMRGGLSQSHELLRRAGGARRRDLQSNLLAFCRVLRRAIPHITAGRVVDACRGLDHIDVTREEDFRAVLQANLISSQEDLPIFDALYAAFWRPWSEGLEPPWAAGGAAGDAGFTLELLGAEALAERLTELLEPGGDEPEEGEGEPGDESDVMAYSRTEVLTNKSFEDFTPDEMRQLLRLLRRMRPKLATAPSRRYRAGFRGPEVDLRRSFRNSLRYGGEMIRLARRRRKVRRLRLTLLCDVSGSMDRYSKFLLQFVYGLENQLAGVDAWVFSTRLTEVTRLLRGHTYGQSLDEIARSVHDWSGGTAIGHCLWQFVRGPGQRRVNRRSVIIIISDGWDRGDITLLAKAMRDLKGRAFKVIWLNPLLGSPSYQPLCAGMRAALPYADYFLPAHNLESLMRLSRTLQVLGKEIA